MLSSPALKKGELFGYVRKKIDVRGVLGGEESIDRGEGEKGSGKE